MLAHLRQCGQSYKIQDLSNIGQSIRKYKQCYDRKHNSTTADWTASISVIPVSNVRSRNLPISCQKHSPWSAAPQVNPLNQPKQSIEMIHRLHSNECRSHRVAASRYTTEPHQFEFCSGLALFACGRYKRGGQLSEPQETCHTEASDVPSEFPEVTATFVEFVRRRWMNTMAGKITGRRVFREKERSLNLND